MRRLCVLFLSIVLAIPLIKSTHTLRATKYYANHNCGSITADGSRINNSRVHSGQDRWVALSHDMFKKGYSLGDKIKVESPNPRLNGVWIVKDKMGPRLRNSIDFLMTRGNSKTFNNPCKVRITKIASAKKITKKPKKKAKKSNRRYYGSNRQNLRG